MEEEDEEENYWYYYYKPLTIIKTNPDPEDNREELFKCLNCNKKKWYGNNYIDFLNSCDCIKIISIISEYLKILEGSSINWPSYIYNNTNNSENYVNYPALLFNEHSIDDIINIGIDLRTINKAIIKKKILYKIKTKNDTIINCSCKGFKFHQNCKHIEKINEMINLKLNRRQLGISLALKYFNEKNLQNIY